MKSSNWKVKTAKSYETRKLFSRLLFQNLSNFVLYIFEE